jgi:N6-L-threonylcarbamoyladenine synthase
MKVLGIETSCDETAAAVVEDGTTILSNKIASQVELHACYGGIVPEVASRQHLLSIIPIIERAMTKAGVDWPNLDGLAVTRGPGLAGSLLVGVSVAKAVAAVKEMPLYGVNHLEAHIYANWLGVQRPVFPLICLIASGGHSDLVLMRGHGDYTMLGRTRDDAAGEAFDKATIKLPRAWLKGSYDFSFSGLKTALLRSVEGGKVCRSDDAAASFQQAVVDVLVTKTVTAAKEYRVKQILLSGGVAANRLLRRQLQEESPIPLLVPPPILCTDNAAMVAACGYFYFQAGKRDSLNMDVVPGLKLV